LMDVAGSPAKPWSIPFRSRTVKTKDVDCRRARIRS
jgi:hypothetical protein